MLNVRICSRTKCSILSTTTTATTTTERTATADECACHAAMPSSSSDFAMHPCYKCCTTHTLSCLPTTFLPLLLPLLLLFLFGSTLAAPQSSCILCDKNDLHTNESPSETYEEFLFDHQVSRLDAIHALRTFNETHAQPNSCKAVKCTEKILNYCLGAQFINDHCWCELQHTEEGLPYVPHICYVGEKVYKASVGSCFLYEEVKECCCAAALAKEWRHISGAAFGLNKPKMLLYILLVALSLLRWHWRISVAEFLLKFILSKCSIVSHSHKIEKIVNIKHKKCT